MNDDLIKLLKEYVEEEAKDMEKYRTLAMEMKDKIPCSLSGVLYDIARDEETHHDMLEFFIDKIEREAE